MTPAPPQPQDPREAAGRVHDIAAGLGFGLVGIAPAYPSRYADAVRQWIADGNHGEMVYLHRHLDQRLEPAAMMPGVRSIIAVADAYPASHPAASATTRGVGRVARYAWGDDYHDVIKRRLHALSDTLAESFPGHRFRTAVDTAPALEREHAARAGLGWQAKNTMLIHPRHGSYLLLGLALTTLDLMPLAPADSIHGPAESRTDHCGTCTRCLDACPTRCITSDRSPGSPAGRSIDARRCISYLTLEHRGPIDAALHEPMGDWVAGCDVCQEVCPFNGDPLPLPIHPRYAPRPQVAGGLPLLELLDWKEDDRRRGLKGSALKRMKLPMIRRNALIALSNDPVLSGRAAVRRRVEAIAADDAEDDLVRTTAQQVLQRWGASPDASR
jgi:epoxyqueuosine reductase